MKKRTLILNWIAFLLTSSFLSVSHAQIHPQEQQANKIVSALYHNLNLPQNTTMDARLAAFSSQFLGKPYLLGALGEGIDARYDQQPKYRVDAFDCETYVNTVLALALAKSIEDFKQCFRKIRYYKGQVDYLTRNHFTSLDWNPNNQRQGFLRDITPTFKDKNNLPVAKIATALIDKPSWYKKLPLSTIRLHSPNEKEQAALLAELKRRGSKLPKSLASIPYLPLTALFDKEGNANQDLFAQIPNGALIEIVRPNWNLREQIGTNLNVSHMGLAFWQHGTLFYREASAIEGKIIDISLIDYLKATLKSPTIKGINVQIVVPQEPLAGGC